MSADRSKSDFWAQKAKREGYPARSVYKLQDLQEKYSLIKPEGAVLDLGAAPGSWSMYALKLLKGGGRLFAIDLQPLLAKITDPRFEFFRGDIFSEEALARMRSKSPYDAIISDAAPSTTGDRTVDTGRSFALTERVVGLAAELLKPRGKLVFKIFQGGDEKTLLDELRRRFASAKSFKPKAVRSESFETYFVGLGFIS